ncbi:tetratricopeptide repeat protein [Flavihumibacter sp. CACIAM 22H1]|uniref:tetratricopeptide repeat protein n=1 Tax=Flavihumibacter sp. CACIAM 22H1 TaxID=1812911 RepID=UPI0007A84564|nr:tetratricopeptide repeat protein [Flavihumibacter sp. CACIAM 22H1]KYP14345.1 MAG: hypothetical protein A1D16_11475 [Flavihumibacter sp. CACIAM 22H1]
MSAKAEKYLRMAHSEMERNDADLKKVFNILNKSADLGNPEAIYALGTWYLHGRFVNKNTREAVRYLKLSAKLDYPDALFDLAICYELGEGIARNTGKAVECYLKAALLGEINSLYELGRCYYYGIGIEKNTRIAKIWLQRASQLKAAHD